MFYAVSLKKLKKWLFRLTVVGLAAIAACLLFQRLYPLKYADLIEEYSAAYSLDPALVASLIHAESRFDPNAKSPKGASGLMQLMAITADWGAEELGFVSYDPSRLFEPELNIQLGCWYLAKLINQYGDVNTALAAYNAGSGNVSKWLGEPDKSADGKTLDNIPFFQTRTYVEKINRNTKIYKLLLTLHGGIHD